MAFITLNRMRRAFTLIELLVVIAIIAILAAILFPVFAQAKAAAKKTVDIMHMNQIGKATGLYTGDSDGRYMLSNSGYVGSNCWGCGPPDTVPGQVLQPYVKSTAVFLAGPDPMGETARILDQARLEGWGTNLANISAVKKAYALMVRSNVGYNYAFFSPWITKYDDGKYGATSGSVSESEVKSPAGTLMFAQSIWDRDPTTGVIKGGGNWVIETPCWLDANGNFLRPLDRFADRLWSYDRGWEPPASSKRPGANGWLIYGGTWPFHNQSDLSNIQNGLKDGQVVIQMADTSTRAVNIKKLADGCSPYTGTRLGRVIDQSKFMWDLE